MSTFKVVQLDWQSWVKLGKTNSNEISKIRQEKLANITKEQLDQYSWMKLKTKVKLGKTNLNKIEKTKVQLDQYSQMKLKTKVKIVKTSFVHLNCYNNILSLVPNRQVNYIGNT